jgi:LysM repeat protein
MVIAATFFAAPAAAQEGTVVVHTVQPGETLSEIAAQYAVTAEEILALNDLDDPDAIVAGQQLRIPGQFTEPAPEGMHRVQPGETLTSIAARYDLAIGQLMSMNDIQDADELTAGQLLIVSTKLTATPTPPAAETPTAAPTPTATTVPDVHTVSAGETLTSIARRYGLTVGQLMAINGIDNPDELIAGQVLLSFRQRRRRCPPLHPSLQKPPHRQRRNRRRLNPRLLSLQRRRPPSCRAPTRSLPVRRSRALPDATA